ncbi:MAG: hypothetical protein J6P48_05450 [Oscillospiraceae bacterium]|nr:hypothetical protein [Oscillospiraceae bacterium]
MKRNVLKTLYISLFFLLCLVPSLGIAVFGPSEAAANEVLSRTPSLRTREGILNVEVLNEAADWTADHFALRQEFATAWSAVQARLFRSSAEEKVILGRDDWLYYRESLDDYRGIGLRQEQLDAAVRNLALMQEYAEAKGAVFVFTVAPNKNSLYPEHMPGSIAGSHERSNAERIAALLNRSGINYVNLFDKFGAEREILYFQTDSHWNARGAALAADCLLAAGGRASAFYSSVFDPGPDHTGDLYEMLYPAGSFREQDWSYAPGFSYRTEKDPNGGNAVSIDTENPDGVGTLLCWRDSFGVSLYPYLAECFERAQFSRSTSYDLARMETEETSMVMIELVERNLDYLVKNMAVYPAPLREIPPALPGGTVSVQTEKGKTPSSREMVKLTCSLPESAVDASMPAYFLCGEVCCEAAVLFPEEGRVEISAWIPVQEVGEIAVFCGNEGGYMRYDAA